MIQLQRTERIHIGSMAYEIGEQVERTPESILALEGLESLVMAQRLDETGAPLMADVMKSPVILPTHPGDDVLNSDPRVNRQYNEECAAFAAAKKIRKLVPVPPMIGPVRTTESKTYFHLKQFDTGITSVIPYVEANPPAHRLYRLHIAEIIE